MVVASITGQCTHSKMEVHHDEYESAVNNRVEHIYTNMDMQEIGSTQLHKTLQHACLYIMVSPIIVINT